MIKIYCLLMALPALIGAPVWLSTASAQNVEYVSSFMGPEFNDVKVVGNYAYCAGLNGLTVFDISDPAMPSFVGQACHRGGNAVDVYGNYAYVACSDSSLRIINIADPIRPAEAGNANLSGYGNGIFVTGSYSYVADGGSGLQIINIENPSNPVLVGSYDTPGIAENVFVQGVYAYVADSDSGLQIINISNPSNPTLAGIYHTPGQANDVFVSGSYAYVAEGYSTPQIIDVSDPANPTLSGNFLSPPYPQEFRYDDIFIIGNYAYMSGRWVGLEGTHGGCLEIFSIENPSAPHFSGQYYYESYYYYFQGGNRVFVSNSFAYLADAGAGIFIVDVSDQTNPIFMGNYHTTPITNVFVSGNYAYVATDSSGLLIIDITDPASPSLGAIFMAPGNKVFIYSDYAYLAYSDYLRIINVADPRHPSYAGGYNTPVGNVFVSGVYAYTIYSDTLKIINIDDPAHPTLSGRYGIAGHFLDLFVSGHYAYIVWEDDFHSKYFEIIDVADPADPRLISSSRGTARDIFVSGYYAYLATGYNGLEVLNISDPVHPEVSGCYDSTGYIDQVFVSGNYSCVHDMYLGLQIIDVSDPANPIFAASCDTANPAFDFYAMGNYIYVAHGSSLQILRFTPTGIEEGDKLPSDFSLSQNYPNPFNSQTTIQYSLSNQSDITIDIFDILGRKIGTINDGMKPAGEHQVVWDASGQASGIYFYRIKAGDKVETKKMTLMK